MPATSGGTSGPFGAASVGGASRVTGALGVGVGFSGALLLHAATRSRTVGVRAVGLEPTTSGLRVRCSTIELCPRESEAIELSLLGESGATRTPDLRVRSPALYPTELR